MLGLDYNEQVTHELRNIPLSFHRIDDKHPFYQMPLHWHRPCEIVRVISGKLTVYMNEDEVTAGPNEIVFVNQEIIHGYFPTDCVYEVIDFDADEILLRTSLCKDILHTFASNKISILPFHPARDADLYRITNRLFALASIQSSEQDLLILSTLFELLGTIYVDHHYKDNTKSSTNVKMFKPLLDFIEKSYMNPITLDEMAQVSGMAINRFASSFRDFFRQTPIEYLNSYRMERACIFLINTNLSITEIAYQCGFNDSSYFVKVFKKYKKMTPKKYRSLITDSGK